MCCNAGDLIMSFKNGLRYGLQGVAVAAVAAAVGMGAAEAAQRRGPPVLTGAAVIHDLRKVGNRYCFDGHVHYGASTGMPTVKAAQSEAINSWSQFVYLEYGTDWSNYAKATAKDVKCAPSGTAWGCEVHAIPCT
jgi:hypothetical protein